MATDEYAVPGWVADDAEQVARELADSHGFDDDERTQLEEYLLDQWVHHRNRPADLSRMLDAFLVPRVTPFDGLGQMEGLGQMAGDRPRTMVEAAADAQEACRDLWGEMRVQPPFSWFVRAAYWLADRASSG